MAVCPACERKLHFKDWRPECPGCGVNLNYYRANEKLMEDSEKVEIEHAHFQPKIDRAKASFVGTPLNIARIVLTVMPIGALFLPLAKIDSESYNAISIYNYLADGADIGELLGGIFNGNLFSISLVSLLISAVMFLITMILILMALGKKARVRNTILNSVQLVLSITSLVSFGCIGENIGNYLPGKTASAPAVGIFAFIGVIICELILTIIIYIKGTPVKYTTCLIGGIPSDRYFELVESGISRDELNREMLRCLAELEEKSINEEEKAND